MNHHRIVVRSICMIAIVISLVACSTQSTDIYWNSKGCAFVGSRSVSNSALHKTFPKQDILDDSFTAKQTRRTWDQGETYQVNMRRLPNYDKPGCKAIP